LSGFPIPAWIDLASADKKVLIILLLGMLYRPALALLLLYVHWLSVFTSRRARKDGIRVSIGTAVELAGLLLMKSAAMTAGRWWGSVKYGAFCV
jgi:hypothetical protein